MRTKTAAARKMDREPPLSLAELCAKRSDATMRNFGIWRGKFGNAKGQVVNIVEDLFTQYLENQRIKEFDQIENYVTAFEDIMAAIESNKTWTGPTKKVMAFYARSFFEDVLFIPEVSLAIPPSLTIPGFTSPQSSPTGSNTIDPNLVVGPEEPAPSATSTVAVILAPAPANEELGTEETKLVEEPVESEEPIASFPKAAEAVVKAKIPSVKPLDELVANSGENIRAKYALWQKRYKTPSSLTTAKRIIFSHLEVRGIADLATGIQAPLKTYEDIVLLISKDQSKTEGTRSAYSGYVRTFFEHLFGLDLTKTSVKKPGRRVFFPGDNLTSRKVPAPVRNIPPPPMPGDHRFDYPKKTLPVRFGALRTPTDKPDFGKIKLDASAAREEGVILFEHQAEMLLNFLEWYLPTFPGKADRKKSFIGGKGNSSVFVAKFGFDLDPRRSGLDEIGVFDTKERNKLSLSFTDRIDDTAKREELVTWAQEYRAYRKAEAQRKYALLYPENAAPTAPQATPT